MKELLIITTLILIFRYSYTLLLWIVIGMVWWWKWMVQLLDIPTVFYNLLKAKR